LLSLCITRILYNYISKTHKRVNSFNSLNMQACHLSFIPIFLHINPPTFLYLQISTGCCRRGGGGAGVRGRWGLGPSPDGAPEHGEGDGVEEAMTVRGWGGGLRTCSPSRRWMARTVGNSIGKWWRRRDWTARGEDWKIGMTGYHENRLKTALNLNFIFKKSRIGTNRYNR
jgi:hypothetical protein